MTGMNQQIVTAHETLGMSAEEISDEFSLELTAVKATLIQFSSVYRNTLKSAPDLNDEFTGTDLAESNDVIRSIMRNTEDENLRFRAAKYIRNDKKGRLDALSGIKSMNINISMFNQRLIEAREAKKQAKLTNGEKPVKQIEETVDV